MEVCIERTKEPPHTPWADLNWHAVEEQVRRRQERLDRATTNTAWRTVSNRQKLRVRATSNTLLALRRMTQEHQGKHTAGIDGMVYDTAEARWKLLHEGLRLKGYKPTPVKRVSIPKDKGTQRPLGIPTGKDRVRQAIVQAALEPAWAARFAANSYGCSPGRCTMDAVEALGTTMHQKGSSQWRLDADSSGGFDHIDQAPRLATWPVCTTTWRQWWKAGGGELGFFSPTNTGTPQGGVRSPLLAHGALDGMERLCDAAYADGRPQAPACRKGPNKGLAVIRSADDLVTTAPTREGLETYAKPRLEAFLQTRGRVFSEVKTRIVHITEGLNCLGFPIRKFGQQGTVLTVPHKEKGLKHLRTIRSYLDAHKQTPPVQVIKNRNPVIRGWANYYRHSTANNVLQKVRHAQWHMRWDWAKRRHPETRSTWVKARDFKSEGDWTFHEGKADLVKPDPIPITRFIQITGKHSPYDPALREYWIERQKRQVGGATHAKQRLMLLQRQE